MDKINLTIDTTNYRLQIDFLAADDSTVVGTKYIHAPWGRTDADGVGWKFDNVAEEEFNKELFFDQIVLLNGSAIGATTYDAVTALILALNVTSMSVGGGDVDDTAFTPATSMGQVVMGIVTTDAVDDGDKGALSMDKYRKLYVLEQAHSYLPATHWSPNDGVFTYTSASTITASGFPFTVDSSCQIRSIGVTDNNNGMTMYVNGENGFAITASANVVTIYRYNAVYSAFAATNVKYAVAINYQEKGYDAGTDTKKMSEQSPVYARYTGPEPVISAAQTLTGAWADLGYEVETFGFNSVPLWINLDINDSLNFRIRALAKHTSAGTEEYSLPIRTVSSTDVQVDAEYIEFNTDAIDQKMVIEFQTNNAIPYIQFQVMAETAGATPGQVLTAYVTKGY